MAEEAARCLAEARTRAKKAVSDAGSGQPGPGDAKARRVMGTAAPSDQDDNHQEFQSLLIGDYLTFKADARMTLCAKQTVVLFNNNAMAAEMAARMKEWEDKKPEITKEMRQERKFPQHPLGMDKHVWGWRALLSMVVEKVEAALKKNGTDAVQRRALEEANKWLAMGIKDTGECCSAFYTRYCRGR